MRPSHSTWLDGQVSPPGPLIELSIGPIDFSYSDGALFYGKLHGVEIARRIYVAVRDENWGTIPQRTFAHDIRESEHAIEIHWTASARRPPIDFEWTGRILATRNGELSYRFDGRAQSAFQCNRIGICFLHATEPLRGKACLITHGTNANGGSPRSTIHFPDTVEPNNFAFDIQSMQWRLDHQHELMLEFDGELFESEDQRNWIDDSFKTFCRPLSKPRPFRVAVADSFEQAVKLSIVLNGPNKEPSLNPADRAVSSVDCVLTLDDPIEHPRLKVGVNWQPSDAATNAIQAEWMRQLQLDHLRVELDLSDTSRTIEHLRDCLESAQRWNIAGIECVLLFGEPTDSNTIELSLDGLRSLFEQSKVALIRLGVFSRDRWNTSEQVASAWVPRIRRLVADFAPNVSIVVGTLANFTELNRDRPSQAVQAFVDGVGFSMHPHEHHTDNYSLVETPIAVGNVVESLRRLAPGKEIVVGPITLRKRVNPYGYPIPETGTGGGLPPKVDPRQMSLLGAGWTLLTLKHLQEQGASASSWYRVLGWQGWMEASDGCSLPSLFPSQPGMLFPMYHVFRWFMRHQHETPIRSRSNRPLRVDSLAWQSEKGIQLLIANVTGDTQVVAIDRWQSHCHGTDIDATLTTLDLSTISQAIGHASIPSVEIRETFGRCHQITMQPMAISHLSLTKRQDKQS